MDGQNIGGTHRQSRQRVPAGAFRCGGFSGADALRRKEDSMTSIVGLVILILDIVAIVDVVKSSIDSAKKALWVLLILFLPVIGMVLYFFLGKKK
jgi:hypothetical protein